MTNIVVGIDGSEYSAATLAWAEELALAAPNPALHLVHAIPTPMAYAPVPPSVMADVEQQAVERGRKVLDEAPVDLQNASVHRAVVMDTPAPALTTVAQEVGADLMVVGRHGHSRLDGLLGGTATQVVHQAHCPVLVVHPALPRPVRRVLVGVDGSEHSVNALSAAARWAPKAELVACHVVPVNADTRSMFAESEVPLDAAVDRMAKQVVTDVERRAEVAPERVEPMGYAGAAAEQLLVEYRTGGYDLAVVGSRGLGTLGEIFLGSVSERLLRLAPGPVLVVR